MAERTNDGLYWTKNAILFVVHVLMWTLWTLMIRGSKPVDAEQYEYDIVTVVFMTETTKFVLSIVFHFVTYERSFILIATALWVHDTSVPISDMIQLRVPISDWVSEVRSIVMMAPMGIYFAVPAFIYTLYNSLFFFNLIHFDPVSYRVLINMRILWSGILFQIFFSKRLGWQKWFALFLLMLGCAVNQLTPDFQLTTNLYYIGTIVFQSLTSSFGGVYSEVLLKRDIDISINVKNMYLYAFSMVFNFGFIASMRPNSLRLSVFFAGYTSLTWSIVFVGALCGFTTALFLRHLNILLKEYAHSGEMFLTAILSAMFFAQPIDLKLIASMMLVCISVLIYNRKQAVSDEEVENQPASTDEEALETFVSLEEQTTKHIIIGESPEHSAVEVAGEVAPVVTGAPASVKPLTSGDASSGESGAV